MWVYFVLAVVLLVRSPAAAQEGRSILPADDSPFEEQLKLLDFREPTTIQGRVRLIDGAEQTLWLDWEMRLEVHASGKKEWREIEGEVLLLLYALDGEQFARLKAIEVGTRLLLIVQADEKGRRRILVYQDASLPPQFPL